MQIYDYLKVKFSAAQNEEKVNLKAELAFLYEVQNESAQKVAYWEGFCLKNTAYCLDKWNFQNQCKIIALPSKKPPSGPYQCIILLEI